MLKKSTSQLTWIAVLAATLPMPSPAAEGKADDELAVVEITGSRIPRVAIDTPNPVMTLDAADIEQTGRTNLTDILLQLPALVNSTTSHDSAGSQSNGFGDTGINLLNLRNLGTDRTLVLVNGRRHVAGMPGTAAVDINTIPLELIERVDVLTGGVSAIYGADGVSGVVNFVTRHNFEGLAVRGQAGTSNSGDANNYFVSITGGKNLFGNRGNVALSYQYNADQRVSAFDRPRSGDPLRSYSLQRNPADEPDDPHVFDRVLLNDVRYADSSRDGAFDTDWDFAPDFTGHGTPYNRGLALTSSGGFVQGGSSTPLAGYGGDLLPRIDRHSLNLLGSFDVTDRMRLFAEAKYVNTDNFTRRQPSFDYFSYINADNPYMPAVIRNAIVPGAAAAFGLPDGVLMTRDHFDIGTRGESVKRETLRSVLGLEGRLAGNNRYEFSYTYGETAAHFLELDYRVADRYFAALDAVDEGKYLHGTANGHVVCRIDVDPAGSAINPANYGLPAETFTPGANSGCAPLNLFGEYLASDAAQQFATADVRNRSKVSQQVISGSISGDLGREFALQGGPLAYAAGAEYRKEKSSSVPDQLIQDGLLSDLVQIKPERGSFDVKELFAEINVPVLRDVPLAQSLSFGAAARLSDYSTVGNTTTWKLDARYAPVKDIMFRSTWSEAVRAPNITELFAPSSGGAFFVDDPCDPTFVGDGSQFRAANCRALLTQLGVNPNTFSPESDPQTVASIAGTATGNPQLKEEKARTWTIGFLLRPRIAPGLSFSFDWYDIKLKNAINTATAQEFAQLCVDQPTLNNVYCDAITRDPTTGFVDGWTVRPENVAAFTTAGADFTLAYAFAPFADAGSFHLTLHGGYLDKLTFIATPGAVVDSKRGGESAPKFLVTGDLGWTRNGWSANYGINYFSKTRRFTTQELTANPDLTDPRYFFYKAKWEHDLRVGFTPPDSRFSVYAGANNLFNAQPSPGARSYPVSFVGGYMYAGVKFRTDQLP